MQLVLPDYATRFEALSLAVCFLDLKGVGDVPRQATGFFWRHGSKVFLITNWHVVTSVNMTTGQPLANGWCPAKLLVQFFTQPELAAPSEATMGPNTKTMEAPV